MGCYIAPVAIELGKSVHTVYSSNFRNIYPASQKTDYLNEEIPCLERAKEERNSYIFSWMSKR